MPRFASDENLNNRILRGLQRRSSSIDVVRIQDTEISGADDQTLLEWCVEENRVLLTQDASTLDEPFQNRLKRDLENPGIIVIWPSVTIAEAIEDILLIEETVNQKELKNKILYLPL